MESLLNEARAIGAGRKAIAEQAREATRIVLNILWYCMKNYDVTCILQLLVGMNMT